MNRSVQMSWYDPVSKTRSRVQVPESDVEAFELLRGGSDSGLYIETYSCWRQLGAPLLHSLYRVSSVAQERDSRREAD